METLPETTQGSAQAALAPRDAEDRKIDRMSREAKAFALSQYFSDINGDERQMISQAYVKIKTGDEFGVPASAAVRGIHIIKGKPAISSGLMSGLIKRSAKYDYRPVKPPTSDLCQLECFEIIEGERVSLGVVNWPIEKAERSGLTTGPNKHNWQKWPERMLFARAISEACTIYFPDLLLGGVYLTEEMEEAETTAATGASSADIISSAVERSNDTKQIEAPRPDLAPVHETEAPAEQIHRKLYADHFTDDMLPSDAFLLVFDGMDHDLFVQIGRMFTGSESLETVDNASAAMRKKINAGFRTVAEALDTATAAGKFLVTAAESGEKLSRASTLQAAIKSFRQ